MPRPSRQSTPRFALVALVVALVASTTGPAGAQVGDGEALESISGPAVAGDDGGDVVARRDEARRRKDALAVDLDVLNASEEELQTAIDALAADVTEQQADVNEARDAVTRAEAEVAAADARTAATVTQIAELKARLVERAVDSFITPAPGTFYVVVESPDPAEAGRKQALLDGVTADDLEVVELLEVAEGQLRMAEEAAAALRGQAEARRGEAQLRLEELEGAQAERAGLMVAIGARQADVLAEIDTFAAAEAELDALIAVRTWAEAERVAAERSALVAAGRCLWPTAGSPTSEFGSRWGRLHAGIDIGARTGTPIVAALPGTVVVAGSQSGYGNTVVLDHGGGRTTLYAHQSRVAASEGQQVDQGEVIGYVGSTGRSTGPHLHFETRTDGSPRNPRSCLG